MFRNAVRLVLALILFGAASVLPAAAQTLQDNAAYQELLRLSDPSNIVVIGGKRYVRTPQGGAGLPGGYTGSGYTRTKVRLPNGQEVEVIDPTKALIITKGKTLPVAELPDRVRKIIAALEKLGLQPKIESLQQAIDGYRLEVEIGERKFGGSLVTLYVHVGSEAKIRRFFDNVKKFDPEHESRLLTESSVAPQWSCQMVEPSTRSASGLDLFGNVRRWQEYSVVAMVSQNCVKRDVVASVTIRRWDSQREGQFCHDPRGGQVLDCSKREKARELALTAAIKPQIQSWMKALAKLVDDLDAESAATPTAKPPEQKPPESKPPPPPTPPVRPPASAAIPLPPQTTRTARQIFAPPSLGQRAEQWWINQENYAAAHPNRWAGDCYMWAGSAITALGVFVPGPGWILFGAGMFSTGVALYHNDRSTPSPELAAVREAREKLERYQKEWRRGFTDAELNELGIFMDDLSKLTREQRQQVYRDADIDFTSRAEAFRQMREAEAQERKGTTR